MTDIFDTSIPDEDHVAALMAETGVDESEARFMLALGRGELEGDVVGLPLTPRV